MVNIATTPAALKQRIKRFFNTTNRGRQTVAQLIEQLQTSGKVYLFGGAIRDIALNGITAFSSDIDLVIDCSQDTLDLALLTLSNTSIKQQNIKQNKFGGYRIDTGKWLVDIWPITQTWAFKHTEVVYDNVTSLLNTTVLNWDAIIYDFGEQTLIHQPEYFNALAQGHLDLVLVDNPNQTGQAVRILRTLFDKQVHTISPPLARYLTRLIHLYGEAKLREYEQHSYRSRFLHSANWPILYLQLNQPPKNGRVEVDLLQKTMSLPLEAPISDEK
ncbi:nucleotidyltransferase family protein [Flocculibacter collagenilyticus]|uniref:hypothetical protein n=1 Tax=Flocculibacter collagenilyticus TaxID=2744479 RepID=UPI0018F54431|nr:hypothetical protein [Flocculibacter collagenilyticus]